jgi:hypothetical protein
MIDSTQVVLVALMATLAVSGCGGPSSEPSVDRATGRICFELHLDDLPPGTQYEGVASVDGERLQVRVMTGAELQTIDCLIDADGQIRLDDTTGTESSVTHSE